MVSVEFSEAITETLDILKHMEKAYTDKIPAKFRGFLEQNQSQTYKPNFDYSKKLDELGLKAKTKAILATIYMKYWCNEQERADFVKLLNENEAKHQQEIREKYNPENIFQNTIRPPKLEEITPKFSENNVAMVEYKESIFKRFVNKIKSIFGIK